MSKINDGGPAFPMPMTMMTDEHIANEPEYGMSLRDYFAAKAMQAFCVQSHARSETPNDVALLAYEQADAMLKARENTP